MKSGDTSVPARLLAMSTVNRNALATALSRSGIDAVCMRGFDTPAERATETGAGSALVDLRDDGVAGLAAIRTLSGKMPILAITPGRDIKWITAAIDAGATHYLTSPFPQVELAQAVRLLGRTTEAAPNSRSEHLGILEGSRATGEIERRLRAGRVSALLVAATRFESINAAFGRDIGDELLGAVAQRVAAMARRTDPTATVARVAGAEFAVVVRAGIGEALAADICARIDRPFMVGGQFVSIGCRIGSVESTSGEDATGLLRRASAALAGARASETMPVHALGTQDVVDALSDAELETDLRRAIEADEIEILFQPQVEIATSRIVGVEALARWRHATRGEIGAETLFSVAGRSDYLSVLSQHVQFRALSLAADWPVALGHLRLSINLTASDVTLPEAADVLSAMADAAGFPRDRLTVEITESGIMDNLEAAAATSARLRESGIRVAIDDFGTGYSSLAWLKALPLDYLKIDKGLAQDIAGSPRDRIVVLGAIEMARSLGLAVVAEGVETEEQLTLLAAAGCSYWQGFLFAPPLTTDALIARLA